MGEPPVVLVTGAGQGIGRAIAIAFAATGARLGLVARHRETLQETADRCSGADALVATADVGDSAQVDAAVAAVAQRFGRVDVLVCNSGVAGPTAPLWEVAPEEWEATMRVNVSGVYHCCRAALPGMIERGGGSVIVIGSVSGKRPLYGRTPYTTGKLGLVGLVRTLALEAGPHGIRVNLISPGFVAGPRIDRVIEGQARALGVSVDEARGRFTADSPLGRLTEPDEVAATAVFLASREAGAITGEDLNVAAGAVTY